jgi:Protein of unknown function (DUF2855)
VGHGNARDLAEVLWWDDSPAAPNIGTGDRGTTDVSESGIVTGACATTRSHQGDGLHDASEHRAHLSPGYNYYVRAFGNPAFDAASKREIMLLRPLFFASFLVHDLLAERVGTGADTIAITSASSKTAIGLAHLLSTHKVRPRHIVGLTSERNLDFARGTSVYDRVVTYDDREILTSGSVAVADFSGNSALIRKLQDALGNRAANSAPPIIRAGVEVCFRYSGEVTSLLSCLSHLSPDEVSGLFLAPGSTA